MAQVTMNSACPSCGRRKKRVVHTIGVDVEDSEKDVAPDTTAQQVPAVPDTLSPPDTPDSSCIRRFPSLSNRTHCSDQSSLKFGERYQSCATLAAKDQSSVTLAVKDQSSVTLVAKDQSSVTLAEKDQSAEDKEDLGQAPCHAPTGPVGFFNSALSKTRIAVFREYSWTLSVLCIFVLCVLPIYWGVLFRVRENLRHATIAVVNFDASLPPYQSVEPIVGPFVERAVRNELTTQKYPLGYEILPPAKFNNDPLAVRLAVHQEKYWGAIIVNNNATALLRKAVEIGNASYDPFGAGSIVTNQARDSESFNQYITPALTRLASDISFAWGRDWTSQVLANSSLAQVFYSNSPQALSPGIGFSMFNLRPFDTPTAIPTVSIGLIYLMLIAFFSVGFFTPTHMKFIPPTPSDPHPPLKFTHLILWRYLSTITAYLFLSLFYSLVSLAFQIPFSRTPPPGRASWPTTDVANNADYLGRGTFSAFWMLNFMGMSALGLACENVAMLVGPPWTALWLVFWVGTNISTGFYSLELAPGFYKWGYAWPLRQIVCASRTLLFGTNSRLGLNFGILTVWVVLGTILFPLACWVTRWKGIREEQKKKVVVTAAA